LLINILADYDRTSRSRLQFFDVRPFKFMSQVENQNFFAPPAEAKAALFFLEGHYQLNWREGSVERTKF
jgi:hypothetical protein